ncbi:MAG: DUF2380 domain-containing protein [Proteobacteria bacterium]|nr:DUF2380 domain-containing protein [Pseudomonadota bacterium]
MPWIFSFAAMAPALVMGADIRGNTDESWSRGSSWLVRDRLMKN